jgi:RNA polymerase sigma factor (sigma-70 family)
MNDFGSERLAQAATLGSAPRTHDDALDPAGEQFDELYATYRIFLRRLAVRKGVPPRDADDLVQDVFATYLVNPGNVRDLHSYLIGGIRNAAWQYQRRLCASPIRDADHNELASAASDEQLLEGVIRSMVLGATLARLAPTCRETLERFHLNGESAAAIAASRGTSANYVARLLTYCRKRARDAYQSMLKGPS